jgi:hypothetical protein
MPAPYSWLTPAAVAAQLGLTLAVDEPLPALAEQARLAAGALVERARPDLVWADSVTGESVELVGGDVLAGGALLTARLHARGGSPLGLASYGEFGPSGVPRFDPDVDRLLGLGRYASPRVG